MLLEVGRIAKPHGVRGEVIVDFVTDRPERRAPGAVLSTARGDLVVVSARPHQHRWIVQFEGVTDRNQAELLNATLLHAEAIDDEDALWVHELIGSVVVEVGGTSRGEVVAVLPNPAHDLLELDSGALVPVVFVVSCEGGIIVIDPPDGLFE